MDKTPQERRRPNIVLVLVDDMGYSDIGCYGSEIPTPHLDGLAKGGVRFSQMYNCARSCPTRASLLTGLYPHQAGVGHMVIDHGLGPAYQGFLRDDCVTIAEVLRSGGYRTMMSGKWHVGGIYSRHSAADWWVHDPRRPLPVDRGFDEWYGTPAGAGSYFNPKPLFRNWSLVEPEGPNYYYTDAVSHNACQMIRQARQTSGSPFFLYVAYTAPHWPLHAPAEEIARFEGFYRKGWEAVRTARHESLKGMGLLSKDWPISPPDEGVQPWAAASHLDWEAYRMAVYAAQISKMDLGVGAILKELNDQGLQDDTLVLFLSDNGGCHELLSEDGQRDKEWSVTSDGRPMRFGNRPDLMPGAPDTYQSYGRAWANASNSPFRLYKHWTHEGGISTPLIASWPGRIPPGATSHQTGHVMDIMATCLDAAGLSYPSEFQGRPITPLAGVSLLPAMQGRAVFRPQPIFWEHCGNRAVRDGAWKLVSLHPGGWELYHMEKDRTEQRNLAEGEPGRVKEMATAYEGWASRCGVQPWPLPKPPREKKAPG